MPFQKGNNLGAKGRLPATVELGAKARLMAIIKEPGFVQIIERIFAQAKKGSFRHQELLLHYILGKPTDRIRVEGGDGMPLMQYNPVVKVIADTLRLEKLERDAKTPEVIKEEQIKEMEQVLTDAVNAPMGVESIEASHEVKINGTATRKVKRKK
jgi:hypothetical protein